MNIYRHTFAIHCPENGDQVIYQLEIQSTKMIYAERIVKEVCTHEPQHHETLADRLFKLFGEQQIITAHHRGIDIETRRGFE